MKLLLKIAIGAFAVLGVAYTAFAIYATWFLPHCQLMSSAHVQSPDGRHSAQFLQTSCEDPKLSVSRVLIGASGRKDRIVVLEIKGTTDVGLTWETTSNLIVTLPPSAEVVKRYDPYEGWPRVTEHRREAN